MIATVFAALALACVLSPAKAADVSTVGTSAVIIPWGDWVVAVAQSSVQVLLPILLPIVAAYIIQAIRKVYPWASLLLSQRRIEMMIQAAADYGLNAVQGAAKGKTLSFDAGRVVIAQGTQYVIENAPGTVIAAAGGPEGIAKRIFRALDLDETASVENTLKPVLQRLPHPKAPV